MRLSEGCLEAPDVGALVRESIHAAVASLGGQVGVLKRGPPLRGPERFGMGGPRLVEQSAEWVGCSFLNRRQLCQRSSATSSGAISAHVSGARVAAREAGSCGSGRWRPRWCR